MQVLSRFAGFAGVSLILAATALAQHSEKERTAIAAVEQWVGLVDRGAYAESWERAAEFFKTRVRSEQWEQAIGAARGPFGDLVSRKVSKASYETSLPGAPDGEYVVVQFDTTFANKQAAVETVTGVLESGVWKVGGYFVR